MDWNAILQSALTVLLTTVAGIAVKFIVDLIKKGVEYINEKIELIKDEKFKTYAKELMQAAETMKDILLNGTEKKQWVTDKLIAYTKEKGINISEEAISNLIQSIFQELDGITLNTYKQSTATVDVDLDAIIDSAVTRLLNETDETLS